MSDRAAAASGRVLVALVLGQLGVHSAMAGLRMAAPLQALREGYSAWDVGLLLALFAAAPVLLSLHAGRLADRHGYHRPVYTAAALTALGIALAIAAAYIGGAAHFTLLCAAAALTGTGTNMGMLCIQRAAGLVARDAAERVRIFSWLGSAPAFANVVGPVAAGFVIDAAGFGAAYAMLLALPLVTVLAARRVPAPAAPPAPPREGGTAWELLQAPGMKRLLTVNWLVSMCWDVHTFAVPVLGHERGFSASTIGLILGVFTLSVTLTRLAIPALVHRAPPERAVVQHAMVACALVFAAYPLAPTPALMGLCAVALGVALGWVQPMVLSLLHHITPDQRHGEALALRSVALNGSSTLMPLLFGALGAATGVAALFWMVGAAVGAGSRLARRLAPGPAA